MRAPLSYIQATSGLGYGFYTGFEKRLDAAMQHSHWGIGCGVSPRSAIAGQQFLSFAINC
jgi:hypothetical protein